MRTRLILKQFLFVLITVTILMSGTNAFGQFVEDYGNVGTLKNFKGQVRDAADGLVPGATVHFKSLRSDREQSVEADEIGVFTVKNLKAGEYKARIVLSGFNITEFSVTIAPNSSTASKKFVIVRLGPGCASGGSVELENKIKKE